LHGDPQACQVVVVTAREWSKARVSRQHAESQIPLGKETTMAKYGRKAQEKVHAAMQERKEGSLRSGRSGKKVKSRKQAIAIGLSEARRAGAKVPKKKS
jgi:hypothetical protein